METIQKFPIAKPKNEELKIHNDIRIDPYYWLNNRDDEKVISYLEEENEYYESQMKHTKAFRKSLYEEMRSRIKEDDTSVPYKYNGYWYITRFETGKDYPIYTRKKETLDAFEEILIDCNEAAEGFDYYKVTGITISPDNKIMTYGLDTVGRREYVLKIKNLVTGEYFEEEIKGVSGSSAWANDNKTLFYTAKDSETLRSYKICRHTLGTSAAQDITVYEEMDDTFDVFVCKSKSQKFIFIGSSSTLTSEYRYLNADTPMQQFSVFQERIRGVEYGISHYNKHFYIITNVNEATNFKLMKTKEGATQIKHWQDLIEHRKDTLLEDIDIFKEFLVVSERTNGLNQIRIISWDSNTDYYLPFDNETYTVYSGTNVDFNTEWFRYGYCSLTTPTSVIEFNMKTQEKKVLYEQEVLGGSFNKKNYISERIWATAQDGVKVPMSIIYKKGIEKNGKNPVLQYAYGSYGHTIDPYFSTTRLSLLDRGFIYVISHVRGGEYLGRQWYEQGKLLNKKNTFTDFVDCSKYLISQKYTNSEHLYAMGGSAGGLLIGAVINMAPNLYNGVIAAVPFVDVVTTMLDDTIPLTTGEYDEWGNPNENVYYKYMKSYSPYDNVVKQEYPNILVTTGLHDSQVQYWEPAKWVSKLRKLKKGDQKLLLHTNMEAGHSGASGRFEALKELAEEYVFLFDLEGINS